MSIGSEIADRAVGFCRHIPEKHRPHDWACAACVAKQADTALSEKEAEIARLKAPMGGYGVQSGPPLEFYPRVVASLESQLAALRVERDEAVAHLDAIKAKTKPMLEECRRNGEIAQQTVDAAHAEVARVHAEWGADIERIAKAELLSAAERVTRQAAEARAEGAIAAQAKAEQERDEWKVGRDRALCERDAQRAKTDAAEAERDAARAEAEGMREALRALVEEIAPGDLREACLICGGREADCCVEVQAARAATEPGAQPRPAERCTRPVRLNTETGEEYDPCGNPLPCAEHPTSKEGK